jgi:hypothetical protein
MASPKKKWLRMKAAEDAAAAAEADRVVEVQRAEAARVAKAEAEASRAAKAKAAVKPVRRPVRSKKVED